MSYLGFLFGPAVVGVFSTAYGLREGLIAVAAVAAMFLPVRGSPDYQGITHSPRLGGFVRTV